MSRHSFVAYHGCRLAAVSSRIVTKFLRIDRTGPASSSAIRRFLPPSIV
ncbi:hypothetical protein [Caballeronia sp. BCC1704]|nr:hypothetical protein [Caballeronia sp. BCC1704]